MRLYGAATAMLAASILLSGYAQATRATKPAVSAALPVSDDDCEEATDTYNRRMRDLTSSIRGYFECVSSSRGHDDCSSEFSRVRSNQDDFERAIRDYKSECP
jgi:hypothetical protein